MRDVKETFAYSNWTDRVYEEFALYLWQSGKELDTKHFDEAERKAFEEADR